MPDEVGGGGVLKLRVWIQRTRAFGITLGSALDGFGVKKCCFVGFRGGEASFWDQVVANSGLVGLQKRPIWGPLGYKSGGTLLFNPRIPKNVVLLNRCHPDEELFWVFLGSFASSLGGILWLFGLPNSIIF